MVPVTRTAVCKFEVGFLYGPNWKTLQLCFIWTHPKGPLRLLIIGYSADSRARVHHSSGNLDVATGFGGASVDSGA